MVNLLFERGLRKWKPHSAKVPLIAQSLWKWKVLVLEMLLLFCHIIFNIDIQYFGVRLRSTIIYRCSQMCWGRMNLKIKNRNMQGFLSLHKARANVAEINDVCLGTLHSFCHMIFDIDIQYLGLRLTSTVIYRYSKMWRVHLRIENRTMWGPLSLREARANVAEIKDLCLGHVTTSHIMMCHNVLRESGPENWKPHYAGAPLIARSSRKRRGNQRSLSRTRYT